MVMGTDMTLRLRTAASALLALGLLSPGFASATTFSFGTVNPGDVIVGITLAPPSPTAANSFYNPTTQELYIEAFVSKIQFAAGTRPDLNGDAIDGISPTAVVFSNTVSVVSGSAFWTPLVGNNPSRFSVDFSNPSMVDVSLFDSDSGTPMLDANYAPTLRYSATDSGVLVTASLVGDLNVVGGDTDFVNAFGPTGKIAINFANMTSDGAAVTNNLCALVVPGAFSGTNCPGPWALDDFTANAQGTMFPAIIPEPGTALLLGLGLAGIAALRRK